MKSFDESQKILFGTIDPENTLQRVQAALQFLWEEKEKDGLDKVAGDFTYEELISALLHAEASELERRELSKYIDDLESSKRRGDADH
jgi:hypothetical protein